jgi:hypothetical protein
LLVTAAGLVVNLAIPAAFAVIPGLLAWWAFRCQRNLAALGAAPVRWSPGWAACGWFVPLLSLAVPFLVLRELSAAIPGARRAPVLVHAWGAAWIARAVVLAGYALIVLFLRPSVLIVDLTLSALAAAVLLSDALSAVLVQRLTAGQETAARRSETPPPAPLPAWARTYATARGRAVFAVVAIAVTGVGQFLLLSVHLSSFLLTGLPPDLSGNVAVGALDIASALAGLGGYVLAPIAVAMWSHRAYRNLPALGASGLAWSPGWAAGAWFVPFANLAAPYAIARDLWSFHLPAGAWRRPPLLTWWLTWAVGLALSQLSTILFNFYTSLGPGVDLIASLLGILAAVGITVAGTLAVPGLLAITRRQEADAARLARGGG